MPSRGQILKSNIVLSVTVYQCSMPLALYCQDVIYFVPNYNNRAMLTSKLSSYLLEIPIDTAYTSLSRFRLAAQHSVTSTAS